MSPNSSTPIGIGIYEDHNAGVAAVQGGRVVLYCELERLTRVKNQAGAFPDTLTDALGALPLDDVAAISAPCPREVVTLLTANFGGIEVEPGAVQVGRARIAIMRQQDQHALFHFLAALPLREVSPVIYAVLIFDAEQPHIGWVDLSAPLSATPNLHLRPVSKDRWFNGEIFASLYGKLFYGDHQLVNCGKLMGLASWGRTRAEHLTWLRAFAQRHFDPLAVTWQGYRGVPPECLAAEVREALGIDARQHDLSSTLDLASAAQELFTHELVSSVAERMEGIRHEIHTAHLPPPSGLIYGGGCALSIVSNARLAEAAELPLIIPPYAHDASQFVGAAVWAALLHNPAAFRLGHGWDGLPSHTIGIPATTDIAGAGLRVSRADAGAVARRIAEGQLVALVDGGAEAGPRALGHRSLLANALDPGMRDRLNLHVKRREWYRPFAPALPRESFPHYFDRMATSASAYMLDVFRVAPQYRALFGSVTSPDGATRPQAVDVHSSPWFHELLGAFASLTGHPIVLNTSLNAPGLPIALDLSHVLEDCRGLGVNALVVNGLLLEADACPCSAPDPTWGGAV